MATKQESTALLTDAQSSDGASQSKEPLPVAFRLYKRRWLMLAMFSILTMLSTAVQFTPSAIQSTIQTFYNVDSTKVILQSIIINVIFIPSSFIVAFVADTKGLKTSLVVGVALFTVGCWVRWLPSLLTSNLTVRFWVFFGGQIVACTSLPFIGLNVVSLFAANWFGVSERTIAATVAMLCNIIGSSLAYGLGPAIVNTGDDIALFLLIEAGAVTVIGIVVLLAFNSKPPTPPSSVANEESSGNVQAPSIKDFFLEVLKCLKEVHYLFLLVGFGLGMGSIQSILTLLNQIMTPEQYTQDEAGFMGVTFVLCSIVGALVFGALIDRTRRYALFLRLVVVVAAGLMVGFVLLIKPGQYIGLMVLMSFLGFMSISIVPICMEAAVEVTFPVPEATSTGLMSMLGTGLTVVVTSVMNTLQDPNPPNHMQNGVYMAAATLGAAAISLVLFNGKLKRLEFEREQKPATINS